MRSIVKWQLVFSLIAIFASSGEVRGERIKTLADLKGVRPNQLVGYGLVVGLAGTGDDQSAKFSSDSVVNMLQRLGTNINSNQLRLKNVAAVMVTANLPAFAAVGQRVDVTVSSIGTAKSLEGGTLLMTPLKGPDKNVYAVAQGALSVGGFLAVGKTGSSVQKNHPTVGRVPAGGLVEREVPVNLEREVLEISLRSPDFTTSVRIAQAIEKKLRMPPGALNEETKAGKKNKKKKGRKAKAEEARLAAQMSGPDFETPFATSRDPGTVMVRVPQSYKGRVPVLISELEMLDVTPDLPTKVVINERTGTVVLGKGVRLSPVAVAHGGLTVEVEETPMVSQPGAFSTGNTEVVERSGIAVTETKGQLYAVGGGASLNDVVRALNALGVTPRDLVAILQALKSSGALHAELEIQ